MKKNPVLGVWVTAACVLAALLFTTGVLEAATPYVVSGLLGLAVGEILRLQSRMRSLETRLLIQEARAKTEGIAAPTPSFNAQPETVREPSRAKIPIPPIRRERPDLKPVEPPWSAPQPTFFDRWLATALDWLKRGNPVARAGIVILFFGGSYLAKYAAEYSLLPIELRMAALALGAITLLGIGWRLRTRQRAYAQILQGGGIAGFYLTVFAATRLFQLLPQGLALALMIVIALCGAVLAVAQDALALAVIGTGGGFLAPILLSTGGSLTALFGYYTVLNLGLFAVAWFRAWRVLNLVGFIFTFGIAGLFRVTSYTPDQLFTMDFFLLLFFVLYVAVAVLFSIRQKPDLRAYISGTLVFGLPLVTLGLHGSLISQIEYGMAWSALGFGFFYVALACALRATRLENLRLLTEAFAALGVIFGSLAIPLAFDHRTTAAMWAVEGTGLLWIGIRQQRKLARAFGVVLQLAGGFGYLLGSGPTLTDLPILNSEYIGSVLLGISGLLSGAWMYGNRRSAAKYEAGWDLVLALWGTAWWIGGGLAEIRRCIPNFESGAGLSFAALTLVVLMWIGLRRQWPALLHIAVGLLPLTAVGGLSEGMQWNHPFAHAGAPGWLVLLAAAYWLLHRLDRQAEARDSILQLLIPWLHAGTLWLAVLIAAWESSWQTARVTGGVWSALPWGVVPALGLWLLSRRPLWPAWPVAEHADAYDLLAAAPLVIFGALWSIAINLVSDGDPAGLAYLPLLNPQDIAVALFFAATGIYWKSLSTEQRLRLTPADPRIPPLTAAACVFLWLNAALIRALHYLAGGPLSFNGIHHSTLVQAALSIFWGLLGFTAMTLAARRAQRMPWMIGAGLMAVVVVKLFLVDTAGRGTLARIVSFLVVGALLLMTGYLSPLPPRRTERAANTAEPEASL